MRDIALRRVEGGAEAPQPLQAAGQSSERAQKAGAQTPRPVERDHNFCPARLGLEGEPHGNTNDNNVSPIPSHEAGALASYVTGVSVTVLSDVTTAVRYLILCPLSSVHPGATGPSEHALQSRRLSLPWHRFTEAAAWVVKPSDVPWPRWA